MHAVLGDRMIKAVLDANLLVSGFLSRNNLEGVSTQLLRFAQRGAFDLNLSPEILAETLEVLIRSDRLQQQYGYTPDMAVAFCERLSSVVSMVDDPPAVLGAVPRDPDDDKIIACAVAAEAQYIVTRDRDLLSLGDYGQVAIISPERFLEIVRAEHGRLD